MSCSESYKNKQRKSTWKRNGIKDDYNDNYITLSRIWKSTKFCDECGKDIEHSKCCEHDHKTRYFRGIVCHCCNNKRATLDRNLEFLEHIGLNKFI